ncbi:uncharacterized protein Hap1MRO34_002944 [Clarias gariepinus]
MAWECLGIPQSSDGLHEGPGYEGRVDVPEDELHKGNCSLVLKNVKVTDDNDYRTFVVDKAKANNWEEINKVELSVEVLQNMSAPVGSTVVLPCDYRDLSLQTLYVEWYINHNVVFKRQGKMSHQGKGYEGRVDVPEDELLKGNCSLVLKNVRVTDAAVYKSSMVVKDTRKPVLVQKVQLSVYKQTEKTSDKNSASPDRSKEKLNKNLTSTDNGKKDHYYWLSPFILLITLLFGLVIWALINYRFEVARLLFSFI